MSGEQRSKLSQLVERVRSTVRGIFSKKGAAKRADSSLAMNQVLRARQASGVPTMAQIRHLPRLLTAAERRLALGALALVLIVGTILGVRLVNGSRVEVASVGGEYTEGFIGTPQLINPLYALTSDVDNDLTHLVYSGLLRYDSNEGLIPDLAESVMVSDDQRVYEITIRDDARWHDGKPVRVDDVIFTVNALQNPEYRSPLQVSFTGVGVDQVDERTVRFTLAEPFAPFESLLTVPLLPAHLWGDIFPQNAAVAELNKKPIGSGPYKFEKFTRDSKGNIRSYTLVRNADFYRGAPNIETLNIKFYPDTVSAIEALRNNNIEGISYLPPEAVEDFGDDASLQIFSPYLAQYTAAFFNQERQEILKDAKVREALALATRKEDIIEAALFGQGKKIDSFILEGMIGEHPNIKKFPPDAGTARTRLDEAGWTLAEGAEFRSKDGVELRLELVTINSPDLLAAAEEIKAQWKQIGVDVIVTTVTNTTFQNETLRDHSYDILLSGELYGIDPDPYAFWHSSQTEFPGLNLAQFSNRKADEFIETGRTTTNPEERAEAYRSLQDLVAEEIPAIFIYQPTYSYAVASKIENVQIKNIIAPADRFSTITEWFIKKKRVISG